jgi:hypothetical protein
MQPPITKLSLPLWIDPNTGQMLERNANLAILPDTISPVRLPNGSSTTFVFTITNFGPGLAQDLETTLTLPSGLSATSTAFTLGTTQITGNIVRLSINQLAYERIGQLFCYCHEPASPSAFCTWLCDLHPYSHPKFEAEYS